MGIVKCDTCGAKAKYDAKTVYGPWAYLCGDCMSLHGNPDYCNVLRDPDIVVPQELSFEAWMVRVNDVLRDVCGMESDDLPDYTYADSYADGLDPELVANDVLMEADFF